jgi:hypothetical protein
MPKTMNETTQKPGDLLEMKDRVFCVKRRFIFFLGFILIPFPELARPTGAMAKSWVSLQI